MRTIPFSKIVSGDLVPGTANDDGLAIRAVRVGGVGIDVALIDEVEAGVEGDATGAVKGLGRSGRLIL